MEKNFVEFFSVQFVEPTFTFHHPPSINHERHHALPPERILFPGRVFSLTLLLPEFLSHLPANVNYNLNMNIGACTLACAFVLHDFARTRDPEKKKGGDGQMTRNVGSGKIASGSRKSINIHFVYRDLLPALSLKRSRVFTRGTRTYSRPLFPRPPPDLSPSRAHLFE